jgi:hypothetical protein
MLSSFVSNDIIFGCVDQTGYEDSNLDIFQQIYVHKWAIKRTCHQGTIIFKHYQVDPKNIKCPLQWWGKHEAMFPTIIFLAC